MKKKASNRIIISGGGTGGHVFPAIAIANAIREISPDAEILFVGAKGKLEMQKVPEAGYAIEGLWISGLQRKLSLSNLAFPFKLIWSSLKARSIMKRFKPDVAVGVGGYASGPMLRVAANAGVPCLIQEQNSYAGLTNRLLAAKAAKICVAYDGMEKFFPASKIILTGNPVRSDIYQSAAQGPDALKHFGLNPEKSTLLILGGSLGARSINNAIAANLEMLADSGVQVIWQCGKLYFEEMKQHMQTSGTDTSNFRCFAFIKEMNLAYAAADVVISRAGALSISELCLVAKPVLFVPSPNVAEDHQRKNVMALVEKQAAVLVNDADARENLVKAALQLMNDENEQRRLSENIKSLARPNAAKAIAEEILKLAS
jgi:UDP-N-acetylglucosamine--N-acetylmuramyl-(pentapeptide) pyrophosphoryl-undecaprenol N-acetylglucosamine transferase